MRRRRRTVLVAVLVAAGLWFLARSRGKPVPMPAPEDTPPAPLVSDSSVPSSVPSQAPAKPPGPAGNPKEPLPTLGSKEFLERLRQLATDSEADAAQCALDVDRITKSRWDTPEAVRKGSALLKSMIVVPGAYKEAHGLLMAQGIPAKADDAEIVQAWMGLKECPLTYLKLALDKRFEELDKLVAQMGPGDPALSQELRQGMRALVRATVDAPGPLLHSLIAVRWLQRMSDSGWIDASRARRIEELREQAETALKAQRTLLDANTPDYLNTALEEVRRNEELRRRILELEQGL